MGETLEVSVDLKNRGARSGCEIVQLYIRDLYASVTRPVKELKKFQRVSLDPGQTRAVRFQLHSDDLAFWGRDLRFAPEPGRFHLWVGPSSAEGIQAEFELV
jgi:beta-glucosidase